MPGQAIGGGQSFLVDVKSTLPGHTKVEQGFGLWHPGCVTPVLRRPLPAITVALTVLAGLAMIGIGIGAWVAGPNWFGLGFALWLGVYGLVQLVLAYLVARGNTFALGLVVASSLLHVCIVGSFMTAGDRPQLIGSLCVAPFVLTALVTSVLSVTRGELDRARG